MYNILYLVIYYSVINNIACHLSAWYDQIESFCKMHSFSTIMLTLDTYTDIHNNPAHMIRYIISYYRFNWFKHTIILYGIQYTADTVYTIQYKLMAGWYTDIILY